MLIKDVEEDYRSDDCDVKLECVENEVRQPVRSQPHSRDNLYMLELCYTLDDQVAYSYCNDNRVCDGREKDNRTSITRCNSAPHFVSWRVHCRSRLKFEF